MTLEDLIAACVRAGGNHLELNLTIRFGRGVEGRPRPPPAAPSAGERAATPAGIAESAPTTWEDYALGKCRCLWDKAEPCEFIKDLFRQVEEEMATMAVVDQVIRKTGMPDPATDQQWGDRGRERLYQNVDSLLKQMAAKGQIGKREVMRNGQPRNIWFLLDEDLG